MPSRYLTSESAPLAKEWEHHSCMLSCNKMVDLMEIQSNLSEKITHLLALGGNGFFQFFQASQMPLLFHQKMGENSTDI